jgi:hypothetical protein
MKRTIAAVLIAASPILVANAASAAGAGQSGGCVEPVPQRSYESELVSYGMAVDYTGCSWWDGGPITLEASLSRLDGQSETAATSMALCGHAIAATPSTDEQMDGHTVTTQESSSPADGRDVEGAEPSGSCSVLVWVDHPPFETALYRGQVTYPWEGGDRTVGFTALCGPTGGCVDLPADPSPALGAASDLYDAIGGGDDSAG